MQPRPTISVLAYCDQTEEDNLNALHSVVSQSYQNVELLVCGVDPSTISHSGEQAVITMPKHDNQVEWYKHALPKSSGEIVVFTSPSIVYETNAFEKLVSMFSNFPECGSIYAQVNLSDDGSQTQINPQDLIPLYRYDEPMQLERWFFSKEACGGQLEFPTNDPELVSMAFFLLTFQSLLLCTDVSIGTMRRPDKKKSPAAIVSQCEKQMQFWMAFCRHYQSNEMVRDLQPVLATELICHAAELIYQTEGASQHFSALLQRAAGHDGESFRLKRLQTLGDESSNDQQEKSPEPYEAPIDPDFKAKDWWDVRYARGGNSGAGSHGYHYQFKRDYIRSAIQRFGFASAVDFGCGDGSQINEIEFGAYQGVDISQSVVNHCREFYKDRPHFKFDVYEAFSPGRYDVAMSLDVMYHVVEPDQYDLYLNRLFSYSKYVLIYTNLVPRKDNSAHMCFRDHVKEIKQRDFNVRLIERVINPQLTTVGFLLYEKR